MKRLSWLLFSLIMVGSAGAAPTYLTGNISNITSMVGGLLIKLDAGVPDDCTGTPYNWMMIAESNKTMIATALAAWHAGQKRVTVYMAGTYSGSGYCMIGQFDPAE